MNSTYQTRFIFTMYIHLIHIDCLLHLIGTFIASPKTMTVHAQTLILTSYLTAIISYLLINLFYFIFITRFCYTYIVVHSCSALSYLRIPWLLYFYFLSFFLSSFKINSKFLPITQNLIYYYYYYYSIINILFSFSFLSQTWHMYC